jgi:LysR family transcriptional activator of nhaA
VFNYHHLHYFWAVAHEENLTRAAEKLHVSQSAVSMQIHKLEEELGHALFERRGKRLVLTEAGRIALDHADAIFAHGRDLESALGGKDRARHVLRVGSLATLSRNFQLGFLRPLFRRDDVEIVVRSGTFSEMLRAIEAHTIDVVLANAAPARDASTPWVAHPIAKQPVSLVGHPTRKRRPSGLAALLESAPLVLPAAESSIRAGFDALITRLGVRPLVAAEVDDMAMLRLLARERIGLAVVPSIVVEEELREGELVEVAALPLVETFFAITLTRRFPNPVLQSLLRERRAARR